jgi:DNA-binding transcriptional LysR family regulator
MEITQLKTFHEIVRTGSYSGASRNLFITQSAVSHQIRKLEEELRIKLFERMGHTMKLTPGGELLADAIDTFLSDLENLKRISEQIRDSKTGHLTIAATNGIMVYLLPRIIKTFRKEFPRTKLELVNRNLCSDLLDLVLSGQVDLAIGPKSAQGLSPKLDYLFWASFSKVLLTAKDHPLHRAKQVTLADISTLPLILFRGGAETRRSIEDAFAQQRLRYEVIMELDVAENVKTYVQMGAGAAILPCFMITPEDRDNFYDLDVSHLFGKVNYGLYYRKNRPILPVMKQFINTAQKLSDPAVSARRRSMTE